MRNDDGTDERERSFPLGLFYKYAHCCLMLVQVETDRPMFHTRKFRSA